MAKSPPQAPPDITAKVYLVGHGYQIDLLVDGEEKGFECRSFGGDYSDKELEEIKTVIMAGFLKVLNDSEDKYYKLKKLKKTKKAKKARTKSKKG